MPKCSVLIVDDGSILGHGLSAVLRDNESVDVIGMVCDNNRSIEFLQNARPHVVITLLGHQDVVDLIRHMRVLPDGVVPVLAIGEPGPLVVEALLIGVSGTLSWRATAEQIATAVHAAARGTRQVSPDAAAQLTLTVQSAAAARNTVKLSDREIEVLLRAADGQTNTRIARALSLSEATVKTYWQRVFRKLDVHDRTTAVTTAMGLGILSGCTCPLPGGAGHRPGTLGFQYSGLGS